MKKISHTVCLLPALAALFAPGCTPDDAEPSSASPGDLNSEVVKTYARIAHAAYEDSLTEAEELRDALRAFLDAPSEETHAQAKEAWIAARLPYLQTEVFRFYAGPIDDEDGPEGLINAWPMDEAYVDYVEGNPNAGFINNPTQYPAIDKGMIAEMNEKDGEENVSSGFHAIEFLLWGQDLSDDGPGNRPFTDYTTAANAARRKAYLMATANLLVENLQSLVDAWVPDADDNYRAGFEADPQESIKKILTGMSMLSGFELSGERLLVAYETQAQEDEHSCFSDTTHTDAVYDALGLVNVWGGRYERINGDVVEGKGVKALAEYVDPELATRLDAAVHEAYGAAQKIPAPFDQAILGSDDAPGRKAIMATITALEDQAEHIVALGKQLGFEAPTSE